MGWVPHYGIVEVLVVVFKMGQGFWINFLPCYCIYCKLRYFTMLLKIFESLMLLHHSSRTSIFGLLWSFVNKLTSYKVVSHNWSIESTNKHITKVFWVNGSACKLTLSFIVFKLYLLDNIKPAYVHQDIWLSDAATSWSINFELYFRSHLIWHV